MGLRRHKNKFNRVHLQISLVIGVIFIHSTLSYGHRRLYTRQELRQDVSCPQPSGQFAHPKHCDRFLNCWEGDFHVETCPASLVFNEKIRACDWKKNVDCSGKDGEADSPPPDPSIPANNEPQPGNPFTPALPTDAPQPPPPPPQQQQPMWKPKPKPAFGLKPPTNSPDQSQPSNQEQGGGGGGGGQEGAGGEESPSTKPPVVVQFKPKPQFRPSTEKPTDSPIDIGSLPTDEPFNPPSPDSEISPPSESGSGGTGGKPPKPTDTDPGFIPNLPSHFPNWPSVKCPISQGILPVSGHCDAVVVCLSGVGHLLRCPHGHSFDTKLGTCSPTRDDSGQDCNKSMWAHKNYNPQVKFVYVPQAVFSNQAPPALAQSRMEPLRLPLQTNPQQQHWTTFFPF